MDNYQTPPPISEEPVVIPTNTDSSTPPVNPGSATPPPTIPSKKMPAKLIATLFGILLLIGGVSAGLVLVNQQQLLEQDAQVACTTSGAPCNTSCVNGSTFSDACPSTFPSCSAWAIEACGTVGSTPGSPGGSCSTSGAPCSTSCVNGSTFSDACPSTFGSCSQWAVEACGTVGSTPGTPGETPNWNISGNCINVTSGTLRIQRFSGPSCPTTQTDLGTEDVGIGSYCTTPSQGSCEQVDAVGTGQGVCSCNTTTTPPTATPTLPGITAVCSGLRAFDESFNELTTTQLSALQAGDVVRFAVNGTTTGTFDQARFTVNGALQQPTNLKTVLNTTTIYYMNYTIPQGITTFNIGAELHESEGNTWH